MEALRRPSTIAFFVLLAIAAVLPLALGQAKFPQWLEVALGGLLTGVLYSLVAIGLVLIFKASGVFNFAQGAMVLFAALTLVRLAEKMPLALAILVTLAVMIALAWAIERWVLRPLVNQDGIVLFMATLGIAYFLDGFGQAVWGSDIYTLHVGMPKEPKIILESVFDGGVLVDMEDFVAAIIAAVLVAALTLFFQKTGTGRALRAVADDHQAAQSIGIPLNRIWVIERFVLRPLVNQDGIVLFMATLGIAYFLDGFGQAVWGSDIYTLHVGMPKEPKIILESVFDGGVLVDMEDVVAAVIAAVLVAALTLFFQKTSTGRALRAVADDHQAAQSIGIALNRIWVIVWSVAGLVALVAGIVWGSKLGVQFSLSQVALKALPVVILGGFTSIPGAIVGGLLIGLGEKLSEVYLGPFFGGGIEAWFAYVLALVFLLFRPEGLFGEKIIDRV
jgi:branched-chain amino acid transport system permease protein